MAKNRFTYKKRGQTKKTAKRYNKKNRTIKNRKHFNLARGGFFNMNTLNSGLSGASSFLQRQQANAQANLQPGQQEPPHVQMFGHMENALGQLQSNINKPEFQAKVGQYGNQLNQHLQTAQQSAQNIYQNAQNGQFGEGVQQHVNTFNNALQKAQGILNDKQFQQNLGAAGGNASGLANNLYTMAGHAGQALQLASQGKLSYYQGTKLMAKHSYNMGKMSVNAAGLGWNLGRAGVHVINQMRPPQQQPKRY